MALRRIPSLVSVAIGAIGAVTLGVSGCSSSKSSGAPTVQAASSSAAAPAAVALPKPDHVVVVLFENKEEKQVAGSSSAPYFNELAARGASFTDSTGVARPPVSHHHPLWRRFASQYQLLASRTISRCSPAPRRAWPATAA